MTAAVNQWQLLASSAGFRDGEPFGSLERDVAAFKCFYTRTSREEKCQILYLIRATASELV